MTTPPGHTYSDTVAGYLEDHRDGRLLLRTLDGRHARLHLTPTTSARVITNLGEPRRDVSGRLGEYLLPGRLLFGYGPVYPDPDGPRHCASQLAFVGDAPGEYAFEAADWWIDQLTSLARFYRHAQFGDGPIDFASYRTELRLAGDRTPRRTQETDTISRLVYGMASGYQLTGDTDLLDAARAGAGYLRDNLRFVDPELDVVGWYHGVEPGAGRQRKLLSSEFDDDYAAIPAYEQIYALVGLVQTYRLTGDPALRADIEGTVRLFERSFADPRLGGYFSHVDPVGLDPHAESLGGNRSRKNWNSVGDHAPAYLFNLYLATGQAKYLRMLEHTFDMIVAHFPDPESPFVQERFHADWSPDRSWGWQQDRAVVGHNLKIAWNLTRMNALLPKYDYRTLAERLARTMPEFGLDGHRGGWYDLLQRTPANGRHEFTWHDRKAWWQQEQAILAYLVLAGHTRDPGYLRHAREAAAFYNAFFLDHDDGGVYFAVQADGLPYLVGTERLKGSHSMSMYHASELCYLATVYTRLLIQHEPLWLWYQPRPDADFADDTLRVAPDALPPRRVVLDQVLVDGEPYADFDAYRMTVRLPRSSRPLTVQARLRPAAEAGDR